MNNLEFMPLLNAIGAFGISYLIAQQVEEHYALKDFKKLIVLTSISFGLGFTHILNHLFAGGVENIAIKSFLTLLVFPSLFTGIIIYLRNKKANKIELSNIERQRMDAVSRTAKTSEYQKRKSASETTFPYKSNHQNSNLIENYYEKAIEEFESRKRKRGLFAKLYSEHNGNEGLVKAEYLKIRAEQFKKEDAFSSTNGEVKANSLTKASTSLNHSITINYKSLIGSQMFLWITIIIVTLTLSFLLLPENRYRFSSSNKISAGYEVHVSNGKPPCTFRNSGANAIFNVNIAQHKVLVTTQNIDGTDRRNTTLESCVVTDEQHWICLTEKENWYYEGSISKENGEFRYSVKAIDNGDRCHLPVIFKQPS